MAILWMDGFEHYGTGSTGRDNMVTYGPYASVTSDMSLSTTRARTGTISARWPTFRRLFGDNLSTVGVGCAIWLDAIPSFQVIEFFIFRDSDGNVLCSFGLSGAAEFVLYRGLAGSVASLEIGRSAPGQITAGAWNHYECKFSPNGATSSIELRINEVTVYSNNSFQIGSTSSGNPGGTSTTTASVQFTLEAVQVVYSYLDDLYAWDTSGSYNNDFIGDKRVATLYPDADTSEADWAPNSGATGYTQIDDTTPDNDTTYITSSSAGDISEFDFQAMPTGAIGISAVQTITNARKTDSGASDIRTDIVSNGMDTYGDTQVLTTSYLMRQDIFEVDPDTGAQWTKAGVDAARVRVEREA